MILSKILTLKRSAMSKLHQKLRQKEVKLPSLDSISLFLPNKKILRWIQRVKLGRKREEEKEPRTKNTSSGPKRRLRAG